MFSKLRYFWRGRLITFFIAQLRNEIPGIYTFYCFEPARLFSKTSQLHPTSTVIPRHIPRHSQTDETDTQQLLPHYPKPTFGEPGIKLATSRFQVRGPTTGVVWPHKNAPLRASDVSRIARPGIFRVQYSAPGFFPQPKPRAEGFSAAETMRPRFFRNQNSSLALESRKRCFERRLAMLERRFG